MSRLLTEQAKAIQTNLSLFYKKTCSHFMFVTVSVLLPFLVSVYPFIVCNVFVVCAFVHYVKESVCVDVQYINVQNET